MTLDYYCNNQPKSPSMSFVRCFYGHLMVRDQGQQTQSNLNIYQSVILYRVLNFQFYYIYFIKEKAMCSQATFTTRFAVFLTLSVVIFSQGDVSTCLYNQRFDFFSTAGTNNAGIYTISLPWRSAQDFVNHSIALTGFSIPSTHLFSYDVWMTNVTSTGTDVNLNITQVSQILAISFQIILNCPCDSGSVILQNIEFIPTVLSLASRGYSNEFTKVYMNFTFTSTSPYPSHAFITSFSMVYSGSLIQQIRLSIESIIVGNNYQTIRFFSYAYNNNVFSKLRFTHLVIDVSNNNKLAYKASQFSHYYFNYFTGTSIPSIFNPNLSQKCIIALRSIEQDTDGSTQLFLTDIGTVNMSNFDLMMTNIDYFSYAYLCIQECASSTMVDYQSSSTTCIPSIIGNCLIFISSTNCSKCAKNYFLSSDGTQCSLTCPLSGQYANTTTFKCESCIKQCLICYDGNSCQRCRGSFVKGGCTNISGCIEIAPYLNYQCISCQTNMSLELFNGTCICQPGFRFVTQLCTNVAGCTIAKKENYSTICIACDSFSNLIISNGSCICSTGFQRNRSNACTQICGDGILLALPCDDGNNENGDGCSSTCSIQKFFKCADGSSSNPSQCIYLKKDVSLSVVRIDRVNNNNIAVFAFKMLPALTSYKKINLTQSVSFQCKQSVSLVDATLEGNQLTVQIAYFQDLEANEANLSISLNPSYFSQAKASIRFNMISDGIKIKMLTDASKLDLIQKGIKMLAFAILGIFFFSFFVHKVIGIEMINSFQVVFFVHLTNPSYTAPYSIVKLFYPTVFDFLHFSNGFSNTYEAQQHIKFDKTNEEFALFFINGFSIGLMLLLAVMRAIIFYLEENSKSLKSKKFIKQVSWLQTIPNLLYQRAIYPFFIGTFLVSMLLLKGQRHLTETSWLISLMYFSQLFLTSLVFFYEHKALFIRHSANQGLMGLQRCHRLYISIYVSFLLAVAIIIRLAYQFGGSFNAELVLSLVYFAFLTFAMVFRPYQTFIHNLGLAANLLTTIYFLVWSALKRLGRISESQLHQTILLSAFLLLVIISLAITLLRIVHQCRIKWQKLSTKDHINRGQKNKQQNESVLQEQQVFMKRIAKDRVKRYREIQPLLFVPVPINASYIEDLKSMKNLKAEFRKKYIEMQERQLRDKLY